MWAQWSIWSTCSEKSICLKGISKRERTCSSPAPNKGGDECLGKKEESVKCPVNKCQGKQKGFYLITVYPESLNKANFFMVLV